MDIYGWSKIAIAKALLIDPRILIFYMSVLWTLFATGGVGKKPVIHHEGTNDIQSGSMNYPLSRNE